MVAGVKAYKGSDQVDLVNFKDDDYFTARLAVARAQEHPNEDNKSVYSLEFVPSEQDLSLPERLRYSFTDSDGSFKGNMGVFTAKQLKGRYVVGVFRRKDKGIEAIIPSNEII